MGSNNRHGSRLDFANTNRNTQYLGFKRKLTKSSQLFFEKRNWAQIKVQKREKCEYGPAVGCFLWKWLIKHCRVGRGRGTGPNVAFKGLKHEITPLHFRGAEQWSVLRQGGARRKLRGAFRARAMVGGGMATQGRTRAALGRLRDGTRPAAARWGNPRRAARRCGFGGVFRFPRRQTHRN